MVDKTEDFEDLARRLSASPDHRIQYRFKLGDGFGEIKDEELGRVCVVDFETTGAEDTDVPIEIGLLLVEYGMESGRLGRVLDRYSALEDPGQELPENIVALTSITDDMVRGTRFDAERVRQVVDASTLLVAHKADFDRGMAERRFDFMADKVWACSMRDVPWVAAGMSSMKLEYISAMLGLFHDAHRAMNDCEMTAAVLNKSLLDGHTGMRYLLSRARRKSYRVWATGAPFLSKNLLKGRGYEWQDLPAGDGKAWRVETIDPNEEVEWLGECVFRKGGSVVVEEVGLKNRFTSRRVRAETVSINGA